MNSGRRSRQERETDLPQSQARYSDSGLPYARNVMGSERLTQKARAVGDIIAHCKEANQARIVDLNYSIPRVNNGDS